MPRYVFKCYDCNAEVEEFCTISKRPEKMQCPVCGKDIFQHFGNRTTSNGFKDSVRFSLAMGVLPEQIPAAMEKWPGSEYTPDGRLVIHNRTEKKLRMKQRGYCEYE